MLSSDSKCGSQQFWSSSPGQPSLAGESGRAGGKQVRVGQSPPPTLGSPEPKVGPCPKHAKKKKSKQQKAAFWSQEGPPCGQAILWGRPVAAGQAVFLAAPLLCVRGQGVNRDSSAQDLEAGRGAIASQIFLLRGHTLGSHMWRSPSWEQQLHLLFHLLWAHSASLKPSVPLSLTT